jgi:hypothetical protein
MKVNAQKTSQGMRKGVLFSLFATSYTPLFILIIFRQLTYSWGKFEFCVDRIENVICLLQNFGLSIFLMIVIIWGGLGFWMSLQNIKRRAESASHSIIVEKVTNRSGEAISYIGTYILPFIFEDFNAWFSSLALLFLLFVIYRIFVNSSLLLINPVLNLRYALYDFMFIENVKNDVRSGMLITRNHQLDNGDEIRIYEFGNKLYYGEYNEK